MMQPKISGWGNVSDMIKIKLNGVVQENVYYYVSANLVEDFSDYQLQNLKMLLFSKLRQLQLTLVK